MLLVDKLLLDEQEMFWQFADDMGVAFAMKYARSCLYARGKVKPHYPVPVPIAETEQWHSPMIGAWYLDWGLDWGRGELDIF